MSVNCLKSLMNLSPIKMCYKKEKLIKRRQTHKSACTCQVFNVCISSEIAKNATEAITIARSRDFTRIIPVAPYMSLRNSHQQSNIPTSIPRTFFERIEPKMQTKLEKMKPKNLLKIK